MTLPIEDCDYFIQLMVLPPKIYAFVQSNGDGTYTIFLDPRRDFWHWVDDWEHELWHIIHDDFYNGLPIQYVEGMVA